jgi:hypothetical protein
MSTTILERRSIEENHAGDLSPPFSAIWQQLMRQDRKTGRFLFPTTFDLGLGTAEERQQTAIWMLLSGACHIAESPGPIMTRREFEAMRTELQTQADSLRETTVATVRLGLSKPHTISSDPAEHYVDPLIEAAHEVEHRIAQLKRTTIVIERDRGDAHAQAVTIRITQLCYVFFDNTMPRVVAALAGALLNTKIERYRVRD